MITVLAIQLQKLHLPPVPLSGAKNMATFLYLSPHNFWIIVHSAVLSAFWQWLKHEWNHGLPQIG